MTQFDYTKSFSEGADFVSEAIEYLAYNENTQELAVIWYDSPAAYVYFGVDRDTVDDAVDAPSVGAAVGDIKNTFGPGTNLGTDYLINWNNVARDVTTAQNVTNNVVVTDSSQTREFSLQSPAAPAGLSEASDNATYELYFDLDGAERTHNIVGSDNLPDAVQSLHDAAEALGISIVVKKAVVTFV